MSGQPRADAPRAQTSAATAGNRSGAGTAGLGALLLLTVLGSLSIGPVHARAQSTRLDARVVWIRGDRVYIAALDSTTVAPGAHLGFHYRGRRLAEGDVTGVYENEFVLARLTRGSLVAARQLGGIHISLEPVDVEVPSTLRLGYPSASRSCLWFACGSLALRHPLGVSYRVDEYLPRRSYRLVREPEQGSSPRDRSQDSALPGALPPWPDTLIIRFFEDVVDEEIALERGELDAAVFWPGEASVHIRDTLGGSRYPPGGSARSTIRVRGTSQGPSDPPMRLGEESKRILDEMNAELFRGDLVECREEGAATPSSEAIPALGPERVRFEVDHSSPGWQVIERFLNQRPGRARPREGDPPLRLIHDEDPPGAPGTGAMCLFEVRCPVLSAPALRDYVDVLGPDNLVRLLDCNPPHEGP